ncbi:MAG: serine/threonine-protein kinase, partial [Leptolyngbyaceae cyanobacterium bins.59]|nr:serine/threonine-protein kinase [Leptolyngbyaceae cyanobacterium bins.59]
MTSELLNNRYRILQALGSGGFGETFLAEDTHLPSGRPCVVKQLKPIAQNPEINRLVQERFHREAAILEELGMEIDQIPQLLAYFQEENRFYLVQEWIAGISLKDYLQQQGKLLEREAREFVISLLQVLQQVHHRGIIHRDIKPSNIMVRQQDGKPILIDFGAAKEMMTLVDAKTPVQSIAIGTPGFMPPEQMGGHPVFASDLYSLALTIIHAFSGKLPYELPRHSGTGMLDWQALPPISPGFALVLQRAIHYSWHDRYPSAEAMLEALLTNPIDLQFSRLPADQTLTLPTPHSPLPRVATPQPNSPAAHPTPHRQQHRPQKNPNPPNHIKKLQK